MRDVGRVGLRALVYFEVVSTLALVIGLVVVNIVRPGDGLHVDPARLDVKAVSAYATSAQHTGAVDFLLNVIPDSVVGGFARGDLQRRHASADGREFTGRGRRRRAARIACAARLRGCWSER